MGTDKLLIDLESIANTSFDDLDLEFLQNTSGNFSPFSTKAEVFIYFMMHSPRPIVRHCYKLIFNTTFIGRNKLEILSVHVKKS